MEKELSKNSTTIATAIHLATFGKWIFPLGNFVIPIILWTANSKKSAFIESNGRQAINFQLSITLYTVILAFIGGGIIIGSMITGGPQLWEHLDGDGFPFTDSMGVFTTIVASGLICGTGILVLSITDLICTIQAAIAASNGRTYRYPISIPFLPQNAVEQPIKNN